MTFQHSYRREIDACRPGSDDLRLPELAGLASAVASDPRLSKELAAAHASDLVLCDGLHEVAVPDGLADRLLMGLRQRPAEVSASDAEAPMESDRTVVPLTLDRRRTGRRAWLVAIPAVAATLLAALGLLFWQQSEPTLVSKDQLAAQALDWYQQAESPQGWKTTVEPDVARRFPIDPAIQANPVRQRSMSLAGADEAVAYELNRSGRRSVLFVIRTRDHYSVATSAYTRLPTTTGNKAVAAWQSGELLYVLVVEGDGRRIDDFVRRPTLT